MSSKEIEKRILNKLPMRVLAALSMKEISEIFNLSKSTVSILMTDKFNESYFKEIEEIDEIDMVIEHHWMGSKEREYFINQLKNKI